MTSHETAGGAQPPVVTAIHVAAGSRLPMRAVESAEVEAGLGVVGDRYHGTRHRHVTVQSQTALDAATEDLGGPVEPGATRRNITISHGDVWASRWSRRCSRTFVSTRSPGGSASHAGPCDRLGEEPPGRDRGRDRPRDLGRSRR